ncbi:MAG: helix-turn-helix domain-containing protein [Actinobacteria bacterium]|nr:helix-turn-helix domain-containing protein [Actinomycetota bacterium]
MYDRCTWLIQRAILDAQDVTALYRALTERGISQSQIARLTDQKQSEVCEIVKGRTVQHVTVLERIADGLGIPRGYIRLPVSASAYDEEAPSSSEAEEVAAPGENSDRRCSTAALGTRPRTAATTRHRPERPPGQRLPGTRPNRSSHRHQQSHCNNIADPGFC